MATAFKLEIVSKREWISTAPVHFTEKSVKALKATEERQEWKDAVAKGLFVVVQPKSGAVSFQFRGRVNGEPMRKTLGRFPAMTLSEARDAVRDIQLARKKGGVPVILAAPEPPAEEPGGLTVSEAWAIYLEHGTTTKKGKALKPSSMAEKKRIFEKNIKPHIGDKPFARVTRDELADVVALKFEAGHGTASNRVHSELSVFWNWSVKRGIAAAWAEG